MREDGALRALIDEAHLCGWRVAHFRPAMTAKGWRTPVQADGQGFPDFVLVKRNKDGTTRIVFAEVKIGRGRTTPEQEAWLEALGGCPGAETYLWRYPGDQAEIDRVLGLREGSDRVLGLREGSLGEVFVVPPREGKR